MRQIEWTPDAIESLNEIIDYYKNRAGKQVAENIYEKIMKEIELLGIEEIKIKQAQELKDIGIYDIYELIIAPWKVYYKIQKNNKKANILFVLDARRNLEEILISKVIDSKI